MLIVTIQPQKFDPLKYADTNSCYLAEAIRAIKPKSEISVGDVGHTLIDGVEYKTEKYFDINILQEAFANGEAMTITLLPLPK